jgi:hypothetical protein
VFRDRTSLPTGEAFDARIRTAIEESDLFVFLISPMSVVQGRYTLTELKFAEQVWPHPGGHVLPVMVEPVPIDAIPPFLRAVTILTPRGNLAAEVAAEAARLTAPWWRRMLRPRHLVPAAAVTVMALAVAAAWLPDYLDRRVQERRAAALVEESRLKIEAGDYGDARKLLEEAREVAPSSSTVAAAQEQLAMESLHGVGVDQFRGDRSQFITFVDEVQPILTRGASEATGERLANLQAHLGWADYLRELGGIGGLDPVAHYRRALETDPGNLYAHAMWGFHLLRTRRSAPAVAEAQRHFAAALESRREREYLRWLQIGGLLQTYTNVWIDDLEREAEAIRVVNAMRLDGEPQPDGWTAPGALKRRIWAIYHFEVVNGRDAAPILTALPPDEHLATFLWLFPEDDLQEGTSAPSPFNYLYVCAQLQERAGARDDAIASYRRMLAEFEREGYDATFAVRAAEDAKAALARLSG